MILHSYHEQLLKSKKETAKSILEVGLLGGWSINYGQIIVHMLMCMVCRYYALIMSGKDYKHALHSRTRGKS